MWLWGMKKRHVIGGGVLWAGIGCLIAGGILTNALIGFCVFVLIVIGLLLSDR